MIVAQSSCSPLGFEFGDESIAPAARANDRRFRKSCCIDGARKQEVPLAIDRDADQVIVPAAAQIGAVEQFGTVVRKFCDESIAGSEGAAATVFLLKRSWRGGQIHGSAVPNDINVSRFVQLDCLREFFTTAAKKSGEKQSPVGIELRQERILLPGMLRLPRVQDRVIRAAGLSGDIRVSVTVNGQRVSLIVVAPTQKRRIDERVPACREATPGRHERSERGQLN
jgi:hypothetical protein